jgi:hypothetical protein
MSRSRNHKIEMDIERTTTTRRRLFSSSDWALGPRPDRQNWPRSIHPDEIVEVAARDGWVNLFALLLHELDELLTYSRPILRLHPPGAGLMTPSQPTHSLSIPGRAPPP